MTNKKIITYVVIGVLVLTSAFSLYKMQSTQSSLDKANALNVKLNEQNKKLLDANTLADEQLDDLSKKYDVISKKIEELEANSQEQ